MDTPIPKSQRIRLTPVQKNALHYVKLCIDRAMRQLVAKHARRSLARMDWDKLMHSEVQSVTQLFSAVASFDKPPKTPGPLPGDLPDLVRLCISRSYTEIGCGWELLKLVMRELHAHAEEYDLLSQVPRERRTRRTKPQTLIESRAGRVDEQVRAWERKIRYAKTRLAKLRRKQKYYEKKGAAT